MDPYQVLGISPSATEEEVKAAYRALAQKYSSGDYTVSPLKEEADAKMEEINAAFDQIMAALRTAPEPQAGPAPGGRAEGPAYGAGAGPQGSRWPQIRAMINQGRVDEALAALNAVENGPAQAEWNFLMGSAYYYKGWLNEALQYFTAACRLAPGNREYEAALRNLQSGQNGQMPGNPYGPMQGGAQAMGCSCCDMCTAMICMDTCCSCMRGF